MIKEELISWAKENNYLNYLDGYNDIVFAGTIGKNDVYEFIIKSDKPMYIGYPTFIVIENGEPKIVIGPDSLEIIDKLKMNKKRIDHSR